MLIDTHCHIHSDDYPLEPDEVISSAKSSGVEKMLCVGTNAQDSKRAIEFSKKRKECFPSVGLHPHEAKFLKDQKPLLETLTEDKDVIAIGECGLDYYYENSPRELQKEAFRAQIELAVANNLPMIFHVREAFDDFWDIIDDYSEVRGVVHSFSSTKDNLHKSLDRGLYVAFNGIMTFTKQQWQLDALKAAPLENIMIETDAPFLTPAPNRGKVNTPENVRQIVNFIASIREENIEEITKITTKNAKKLFGI